MARVVDAKYSTLIGTPETIRRLVELLAGRAAVVDLKFSNFVVLATEPSVAAIREALATTPKRQG